MFGKITFASSSQSTPKANSIFTNKIPQRLDINNTGNSSTSRQKLTKIKSKMIKKDKIKQVLSKNIQDLQGAKFRILNQMLYTRQSTEAVQYFNNNKQDFEIYHQGFRHQTTKWKYRPIDEIVMFILSNKANYLQKKIVDLGCGEGFLYQQLISNGLKKSNILSYDLVSTKSFITIADIANLPLSPSLVDLCIFCLSLMGTNYLSFIQEAWRVLKVSGQLIISEVQSRSKNWKKFIQMVEMCGFQLTNDGNQLISGFVGDGKETRYFRSMLFRKKQSKNEKAQFYYQGRKLNLTDFSQVILQSCIYKKR